ncbi:DUF805 domain-containing protein [Kineococcus auxinigenes]|uniref:DUF805 domain-containing protein n=1 Tax=unclassified Kineococcus TaxID=2621656 RepID=UPI003D7CD8E6
MDSADAVRSCLRQYAGFSGRARRAEYWFFTLFHALAGIAAYAVVLFLTLVGNVLVSMSGGAGEGVVAVVLIAAVVVLLAGTSLGLLLPSLAVTCRRLHDTDRSGWWILLSLVPFGALVLLVLTVSDSVPGPNRYGPSPKGVTGSRALAY